MQSVENQNTEFKREYTPELRKEVVAFANSDGGTIYIGINDDGTPCGVENADNVMVRTANSLRDAVAPDIMPFIDMRLIETEGVNVIRITVSPGTHLPYYIREKGLKPSGVYIRKGSSSQPVSDEAIRQMIIESSSRSFEECRSLRQDLTFDALGEEMRRRGLALEEPQMKTLHLIGDDGLYTNLALILSDQCPFTAKVAVFQGTENIVFRDRREFGGSVIKQMNEVFLYIDLFNKTKAVFSGLDRTDIRDYRVEAVREAWLNCIVHRDYSFSGSVIINIYEDRMEFVSPGGLVQGLELDSIFLGISQTRNPDLAALFYRMRLIESYGTGIEKIRRVYRNTGRAPVFETAMGVFRVTLPNINEAAASTPTVSESGEGQLLADHARTHGSITRQKAEELLGSGSTKAYRVLIDLCEANVLKKAGSGRASMYIPAEAGKPDKAE